MIGNYENRKDQNSTKCTTKEIDKEKKNRVQSTMLKEKRGFNRSRKKKNKRKSNKSLEQNRDKDNFNYKGQKNRNEQ